jgi:hypothetical protein
MISIRSDRKEGIHGECPLEKDKTGELKECMK